MQICYVIQFTGSTLHAKIGRMRVETSSQE